MKQLLPLMLILDLTLFIFILFNNLFISLSFLFFDLIMIQEEYDAGDVINRMIMLLLRIHLLK